MLGKLLNYLVVFLAVALILLLTVMGIALWRGQKDRTWPPGGPVDCPDYWLQVGYNSDDEEVGEDSSDSVVTVKCRNVFGLGDWRSGSCSSLVTDDYPVASSDWENECAKKKWAEECGVFWSGITDNADICQS